MIRSLRYLFNCLVFIAVAVCCVYFFWLKHLYTVPILTYHHFGYEKNSLYVTPENFARQLRFMKNKGYQVISLETLIKGIQTGKKFPHGTVVITVDDGYKDNYVYAYPLLQQYKVPATIFVSSSNVNKEGYLSFQDLREMSSRGISFGCHTKSHSYLPGLPTKDLRRSEIVDCKRDIESIAKIPVQTFCYPTGGFTVEVKKLVQDAGYLGACTTNRGESISQEDLFALKRVKVTNNDGKYFLSFWAKLSGFYNIFRSSKQGG